MKNKNNEKLLFVSIMQRKMQDYIISFLFLCNLFVCFIIRTVIIHEQDVHLQLL